MIGNGDGTNKTGTDYGDAQVAAAKYLSGTENKTPLDKLDAARRVVPKYSATDPMATMAQQEVRLPAPDVNKTSSLGALAGIKDLQTNDVNVAERVGFELAVRSIYILAGRHLGPNHPVMQLIRNMRA